MPYLIDGHNLIGQMATIRLADPDDEAKLVARLQRFARRRQVSVSVVFDRGHYGAQTLGGGGVNVRFARSPSDADAMIKSQLSRLERPAEWVLVSSDREIVAVAKAAGARIIGAAEFAEILENLDAPEPGAVSHAEVHAHVRGDQVEEWLDVFGVDTAEAARAVDLTRKPRPAEPAVPARRTPRSAPARPGAKKAAPAHKSPVRRKPELEPPAPPAPPWGPPPEPARPKQGKADPLPREADGRPRRSRGGPTPKSSQGEPLLKPPPPVHPDEIDEWLEFFGADE